MEEILFQNQDTTRNQGQSLYYTSQLTKCSKDDLIMISNNQGKYLFEYFGAEGGESPVFKVQNVRIESGGLVLKLLVMEVLYPVPVFSSKSPQANVLKAIQEGRVVVRETEADFTFYLTNMYHATEVEIKEVTIVTPIQVQSPIHIQCDCQDECREQIEFKRGRHCRYEFFITQRPRHGVIDLNNRTGEWEYHSNCEGVERDTFEITVWDKMGSYAVQRVLLDCKKCRNVQDVNVVNCAIPVIPCGPIPIVGSIEISNTPTVTFDQPISACIVDTIPLSISSPITLTIDEPLDVVVTALPEVTISSLPTVTVYIGGVSGEILSVTLAPTVSVVGEVTVASLPEVTIANELTVASLPEVTVASLPEVTIANELTVASLPEVTVASLPEVTIANELTIASLPTVVFDRPVEITFVNSELSPLYVVTVTAPVLVAANAFSQIQEGSIVIGPGSSTTLLYNVSESLDTTFFTHLVTPQVTVDLATVYSPLANSSYFQVVDSGTSLSDSNINYGLQVHQVNQFAGVQMTNTSPQGATVEVYVDSQGPVTSVTFS